MFPGYLPTGVPDDATPIQKPLAGEVPDPDAYMARYVATVQNAVDKTNAWRLQRWQAAVSTWLQLATNNVQTGHPDATPPKPLQYKTRLVHSVTLDQDSRTWMFIWEADDGNLLGDPCPDPPQPPAVNTPHIGELVWENFYTVLSGDTVLPYQVVTVLPVGSSITGPLQQVSDGVLPVAQYKKTPGPAGMGGYYQRLP